MKKSPEERHIQTYGNLFDVSQQSQISQRKTSEIIEIYQISFHFYVCAFPPEISSFFGKSFPFLFTFFVLSILWYFPFHVVYNKIIFVPLIIITKNVFSDMISVVCDNISVP